MGMVDETRGLLVETPWALVLTGNRKAAVQFENDLRLRWRDDLAQLAEVEDGDPQATLESLVGQSEVE
ncbi:MAG: hypothetical protein V2J55_16260 [Candidatus Competibacteraceae bacterium]|jgi:hypothetical protein|nr:hypothetical protein [Candidatus Competibacteraceae bacterium]